jgi:hypothetical protein
MQYFEMHKVREFDIEEFLLVYGANLEMPSPSIEKELYFCIANKNTLPAWSSSSYCVGP